VAGLNPVDVQLTLEPPLTSYMPLNTSATLRVSFVDSLTKRPVDPDATSVLSLQPPQNAGSTMPGLTRDGIGLYHSVVTFATVVGKWLLQVIAQGNPGSIAIGSATLAVQVYAAGN